MIPEPTDVQDNASFWKWPEPNPADWRNAVRAWRLKDEWISDYWRADALDTGGWNGDWVVIGVYPTREEAEQAAQLAFDMGLYR